MSSTYCQNHEPETMKGCIWAKWQALCPAMVFTVFTSELPIVFHWGQGFHFVWKEEEINEEGLNNKNPTCLMGTMRVFLHSFNDQELNLTTRLSSHATTLKYWWQKLEYVTKFPPTDIGKRILLNQLLTNQSIQQGPHKT